MGFFSLVVLALFVESLVDAVRTATEAQRRRHWKLITMAIAAAVALLFQLDLLSDNGLALLPEVVNQIFTGLILARVAHAVHGLMKAA